MSSTFSTNLAIELIGTGDQAGSWGNTTNTNLGTLIEQAISGYVTESLTAGTTLTLTIPNGATGVARNMYLEFTGNGSTVIVPSNKKLYFVHNNCSSGTISFKVAGQTGVSIPQGSKQILVSNGTDIVEATSYVSSAGGSLTVTNFTATSATLGNTIFFSNTITTSGTNQNLILNPNGTGQVLVNSATDSGFGANGVAIEIISESSGLLYPLLTKSVVDVRASNICWNSATSGDNIFISFGTEASFTGRGSITYNRGAGQVAYNTTSDRRAKTISGPVTNSGQVVDQLKVYSGKMNWGTIEFPMMIADEAQQTTPYCVTGQPNAVDAQGNPIYQQMDYSALVPLLIAEIQSLRARVAALEATP